MDIFSLEIRYSERFSAFIAQLRERAARKPRGAHSMLLRGLEGRIQTMLGVSNICFGAGTPLTGDLNGVRRTKLGRGRLFYVASPEKRAAVVLHYSATRRDGDASNDAYAEFKRLLRAGEFDAIFVELGLKRPA
jgi:hypothetical protein